MKIERENSIPGVKFKDIEIGDAFQKDDTLYVKTEKMGILMFVQGYETETTYKFNCQEIGGKRHKYFYDNERVIPVESFSYKLKFNVEEEEENEI